MNKLTAFVAVGALLLVGYLAYVVATKDSWNPVVTLPPPPSSGVNTSDWKTYRNAGIELRYPSIWIQNEGTTTTLGADHSQEIISEIRFTGDGYNFIINPDGGFGEWTGFKPTQVTISGSAVPASELIDSENNYHLIFTLDRPNTDKFYFFRINVESKISFSAAKVMIARILDTVKLTEL